MRQVLLQEFATGLVGVRSPYGVPENPFNPAFIPCGSSSGSAVAVARDLVSFSLGTDTAGSGRVPAGLNELVGLKPSLGLLSTYDLYAPRDFGPHAARFLDELDRQRVAGAKAPIIRVDGDGPNKILDDALDKVSRG